MELVNYGMSFQDYSPQKLIEGVVIKDLTEFSDSGGSFCEVLKFTLANYSGEARAIADLELILLDNENKRSTNQLFSVNEWDGEQGGELQLNYSYLLPKVIKAFHIHKKQTDVWFIPPNNRCIVNLFDVRKGREIQHNRFIMGIKPQLLLIPPGVAHGIGNPYTHIVNLFYMVNRFFNKEDELRLNWDRFGREMWEVENG
jgi:dTDP-4-dehydrorhamnose 3,5-epimerase